MMREVSSPNECAGVIGVSGSRKGASILEAASVVMDLARQASREVLMHNYGSYYSITLVGGNKGATDEVVTDAVRMGCIAYKIEGR